MNTILVTGAGGFIGRFFVGDLVERGYKVVAVDLMPSPFYENPKITYYTTDISDFIKLNKIITKHKPDAVVHLAAMLADACESDPVSATRVNIVATQNLLELSVTHGIEKFVFISSAAVYHPDTPEPVREEDAGKPVSFYGVTKYAGELIGLWYLRRGLIDFRALRPTVVFGPGRFRGPSAEYSSLVIERALRGEKVIVRNPDDRVNYIYVRDVSSALLKLLEADKVHFRIYNAGGFVSKVLDFVEMVRKYLRFEYSVEPGPSVRYPAMVDDSKLRSELGWKPEYVYERSIEDYIETAKKGSRFFNVY